MYVKEFPTELQNSGISSVTLPKSDLATDILPTKKPNHPDVFYNKVVLRNFSKFTGKQLCQRLFACNFIKKRVSDTGIFL